MNVKKECPIKITVNINKKDCLANGTFGYVCDTDKEKGIIWYIFSDKVGQKKVFCVVKSVFSHFPYTRSVPIPYVYTAHSPYKSLG